jgi:RHS repeat-associated protein
LRIYEYKFKLCGSLSLAYGNYLFTDKERDAESQLDYFGARYYASNMGRFMSPGRSGLFKVGELENRFRYPFALCFAACRGYGLQLAVANNMIWIAISDYRTLARLRGGMCS